MWTTEQPLAPSGDEGDEARGSGDQSEHGNDFDKENAGDEKHLQSCSGLSGCILPTRRQVISTPIPAKNSIIPYYDAGREEKCWKIEIDPLLFPAWYIQEGCSREDWCYDVGIN